MTCCPFLFHGIVSIAVQEYVLLRAVARRSFDVAAQRHLQHVAVGISSVVSQLDVVAVTFVLMIGICHGLGIDGVVFQEIVVLRSRLTPLKS